mgnify:CR=1 FL=1
MTEPVTLITCSGLSNTGKLTTQAGMALLRASPGLVEVCVPASRPLEEATRYAERILVLDGCGDACGLRRLREIGVEPDLHIVATEYGIAKDGMAEPRFDDIERLAGAVLAALRGERE